MTTAHRPTFEPARGGTGKGEQDLSKHSKQYSSRDLPGHTKLKYRQHGQDNADDLKGKDLKKELEEKERSANREKRSGKESQSSIAASGSGSVSSSKKRVEEVTLGNLDADDPVDADDDDDDDSDEDDTAELMAELNRIKKEREAEKIKLETERKAEEEKIRTDSILSGNPLLNAGGKQDFKVKRRWDDDVVFKNCAKGTDEKRKKEAGFINDALRNEFHKKFMDKYIK